jgi:hypothetical protein
MNKGQPISRPFSSSKAKPGRRGKEDEKTSGARKRALATRSVMIGIVFADAALSLPLFAR